MSDFNFYASLTSLEREYWYKLDNLFQQVSARKPEKGIETLIKRARTLAERQNRSLASALEEVLAGARQRTERRVALLAQCASRDVSL